MSLLWRSSSIVEAILFSQSMRLSCLGAGAAGLAAGWVGVDGRIRWPSRLLSLDGPRDPDENWRAVARALDLRDIQINISDIHDDGWVGERVCYAHLSFSIEPRGVMLILFLFMPRPIEPRPVGSLWPDRLRPSPSRSLSACNTREHNSQSQRGHAWESIIARRVEAHSEFVGWSVWPLILLRRSVLSRTRAAFSPVASRTESSSRAELDFSLAILLRQPQFRRVNLLRPWPRGHVVPAIFSSRSLVPKGHMKYTLFPATYQEKLINNQSTANPYHDSCGRLSSSYSPRSTDENNGMHQEDNILKATDILWS